MGCEHVLHARSHPNVVRPIQSWRIRGRDFRPLRQYLERVLWRVVHGRKHALDEPQRNIFVEQVAHRVDEDQSRLTPSMRDRQPILVTLHHAVEVALASAVDGRDAVVGGAAHLLQAIGHPRGVTVIAPHGDARAAGHGVPRRLSPLDR